LLHKKVDWLARSMMDDIEMIKQLFQKGIFILSESILASIFKLPPAKAGGF